MQPILEYAHLNYLPSFVRPFPSSKISSQMTTEYFLPEDVVSESEETELISIIHHDFLFFVTFS